MASRRDAGGGIVRWRDAWIGEGGGMLGGLVGWRPRASSFRTNLSKYCFQIMAVCPLKSEKNTVIT